jgi:hypothetical protein
MGTADDIIDLEDSFDWDGIQFLDPIPPEWVDLENFRLISRYLPSPYVSVYVFLSGDPLTDAMIALAEEELTVIDNLRDSIGQVGSQYSPDNSPRSDTESIEILSSHILRLADAHHEFDRLWMFQSQDRAPRGRPMTPLTCALRVANTALSCHGMGLSVLRLYERGVLERLGGATRHAGNRVEAARRAAKRLRSGVPLVPNKR